VKTKKGFPKKTKNKQKKKEGKKRIVAWLIRKTWESLESHLDLCFEELPDGHKRLHEIIGDKKFAKKAVKDYARMIQKLTELL